ncbi:MAG: SurA N-terminal domain-containing protein [Myxococcota bacterium]
MKARNTLVVSESFTPSQSVVPRRRLGYLGLFAVALSAGPAGAEEHLIDGVVAQVDAAVITRSELWAEARIVLLRSRGASVARSAELTDELLRSVLRNIVSRELLIAEARRLKMREVPEDEVDRELRRIVEAFATNSDFARFMESLGLTIEPQGGPPPELVAIVRSERMVERFVALRIRQSFVIKEKDIERCYSANQGRLGSVSLSEVRPVIEELIRDARTERALSGVLEQLEKRATLRFQPGFDVRGRFGADPRIQGHSIVCPDEDGP